MASKEFGNVRTKVRADKPQKREKSPEIRPHGVKTVRTKPCNLSRFSGKILRRDELSANADERADSIIPKLFYSSAGRGDGGKSLAIKEK